MVLARIQMWLVLLLGVLGVAEPPAPRAGEETVRICVVAIVATDRDNLVDHRLRCIAKEVQKKEPTLTGFRLVTLNCKPVAVGGKETFKLVEGETATVEVLQAADEEDRVRLTVKAPLMGEITYGTCCGKYFPMMTRYQTKDKDRLILAVMVKPCSAKK